MKKGFCVFLFLIPILTVVHSAFGANETVNIFQVSNFPVSVIVTVSHLEEDALTQDLSTVTSPITIQFDQYVKSVVYGEIFGELSETDPAPMQAQAIAAISNFENRYQNNSSQMVKVNGSTGFQQVRVIVSYDKNGNKVIHNFPQQLNVDIDSLGISPTSDGSNFQAPCMLYPDQQPFGVFYYDDSPPTPHSGFTRKSEDHGLFNGSSDVFGYSPIQRISETGFGIPPIPVAGSTPSVIPFSQKVHGVGMNQAGMITLYKNNTNLEYPYLLKQYYHPSPPFVRGVKATQNFFNNGTQVPVTLLFDQYKFDPYHEIRNLTQIVPPIVLGSNSSSAAPVSVRIDFSERVRNISAQLIDRNGTTASVNFVKTGILANSQITQNDMDLPPQQWFGYVDPNDLSKLVSGSVTLLISAQHQYADSWFLDTVPETVSLDGSKNYEGNAINQPDKNHYFLLGNEGLPYLKSMSFTSISVISQISNFFSSLFGQVNPSGLNSTPCANFLTKPSFNTFQSTGPMRLTLQFSDYVRSVNVEFGRIDNSGNFVPSSDVEIKSAPAPVDSNDLTKWSLDINPTVSNQNYVIAVSAFAARIPPSDPNQQSIINLPFNVFNNGQIPSCLLPRPITSSETAAMLAAQQAGTAVFPANVNISVGALVFNQIGDYNASDPNSRGHYLDVTGSGQPGSSADISEITGAFSTPNQTLGFLSTFWMTKPGSDENYTLAVGNLSPTPVPTTVPPSSALAISSTASGQHLNEASSTFPVISFPLPNLGFGGVSLPIAGPSFPINLPEITMDGVDLNASLGSLINITPNGLGNIISMPSISAQLGLNLPSIDLSGILGGGGGGGSPSGSGGFFGNGLGLGNVGVGGVQLGDVNSLIGSLTCGKGLSTGTPLDGINSQIKNFLNQQLSVYNSLPDEVKKNSHLQVVASGAGAILAKDYLSQGRNGSFAGTDAGLNDAMQKVDRFVSVDAPFLGQDPQAQKELNSIKELAATGVGTASAVLAIFAPDPESTQTGAMGSGMSLADIFKLVNQFAQLRCDINHLSDTWNQFKENTDHLVNGANQSVPNLLSGAANSYARGIDYHLLNNIGIPTELPGADPSLLAAFGTVPKSGDLGSILSAIDAINDPQKMLSIVEGIMASNPVTRAGSGVVPEFSALAGLTGTPAGGMRNPINMFTDQQVYRDPFNPNGWKQNAPTTRTVNNIVIGDKNNSDLATALQVLALPLYIPGIGQAYKPIFTPLSAGLNLATAVPGMMQNLGKVQTFQNPYSANADEPTKELFDKSQVEILRLRSSSAVSLEYPTGTNNTKAVSILLNPGTASADTAWMPINSYTPSNPAQGNATEPVPIMGPNGQILFTDSVSYNRRPKEIRGILRDYAPGKMKILEFSMNYSFPYTDLLSTASGEHQDSLGFTHQGRDYNGVSTATGGLAPFLVDPNTGYFILSADPASPFFAQDFNFIEGQNEVVFHTINWAGKENYQRFRFVLSTLPFYIFPKFPLSDTLVKGNPVDFPNLQAFAPVPVLSDASGNTIGAVFTSFKIFKDGQPASQNFMAANPGAFTQPSTQVGSPVFQSSTTLLANLRQILTDANGNTLAAGATIPDGKYDVMISAYSPFTGVNNPTNTQFSFTVDNEPPVFNIFSPAPATITTGPVVDGSGNVAAGPSAVEPAAINPYLGRPTSFAGPVTMIMSYSVTDVMSPFVNAVTYSVVDGSGNPTTSPYIVVPTPGPVPFESLGSYSVPWAVQGVTFGTEASVILKVSGNNAAGTPGSASVTVTLDRAPPIPVFDNPFYVQKQMPGSTGSIPASVINSNTIAMNFPYHFGVMPGNPPEGGAAIFTFKDAAVTSQVFTYVNPTLSGASSGQNQFSLSYSLGSAVQLPDGIYNVYMTAIDAAGNSVNSATSDPAFNSLIPVKSLQIAVDRTAPVLSNVEVFPFAVPSGGSTITVAFGVNESLDAPELDSANGGVPPPTVKVDIEDPQGNVKLGPVPAGAGFNSTNQLALTLPSSLPAGQYVARVTATDWAGNQSSAIASFVFQLIPPVITAPSAGSTVGGKVVIQGTAVDPDWTNPNTFLGYSLYYIPGAKSLPATNQMSASALATAGWKGGGGDTRISVPSTYQASVTQTNLSILPITGGTLGYWDTTDLGAGVLPDGNYTLLLVVSDSYTPGGGSPVTEFQGVTGPVTVSHETVVVPPLNAILAPPVPASPMTFSPDPADPNNAVTFAYSLSGQAANTRFEILDSSGHSVFTRTASNVSATPIQFYGQPTIPSAGGPSPPPLGYWLWFDSMGWHLRFQGDGNSHTFSVNLTTTNGEIVNAVPVSLEGLNNLQAASVGTSVDQLFPAPGTSGSYLTLNASRAAGDTNLSGIDWQMYANQATLSLKIDGLQQDNLINIGQGSIRPSALTGITSGQVLNFKNTDSVIQGSPAARIYPGSYLWFDGANWNLLLDNTAGLAPATFSGSVVGGANTGVTTFTGNPGNPSNLALRFTTLASGVSLTTSANNMTALTWNAPVSQGQTALIVFSSNSNPLAFNLDYNGVIQNSRIFLGSGVSNPQGQPILLASGANPPLPIVWKGLDDTLGAFVRSGNYTVRLTAEGISGNAVTQVSLPYAVTTQSALLTAAPPQAQNFRYLGSTVEAAVDNLTLYLNSSNPVNGHSTVSFTLNKTSNLTVYVTGPNLAQPVTLQAPQLLLGGPGHVYSFPWSGNYPLATSGGKVNLTGTSSPATFNVVVTDPDNPALTDVETVPITLGLLKTSGSVNAGLSIVSPDGTTKDGLQVVRGDARFYYEAQARGQKVAPIPVTIVVSATGGQQPVLWYPFVPYSFYLTRHFPNLRLQLNVGDDLEYEASNHGFAGLFCDDSSFGDGFGANSLVTIHENGTFDNTADVEIDFWDRHFSNTGNTSCSDYNRVFDYLHHHFNVTPPLSAGENPSGAWDSFDQGYFKSIYLGRWGRHEDSFLNGNSADGNLYTGPSNSIPRNSTGGYGHFHAQTWGSGSSNLTFGPTPPNSPNNPIDFEYANQWFSPQGTVLSDYRKETNDIVFFDDWQHSLLNNRVGPWFGLMNQGADAALTLTGQFNNINQNFAQDFQTNPNLAFPKRATDPSSYYLSGPETDRLLPFVPQGQNGVTVSQISGGVTSALVYDNGVSLQAVTLTTNTAPNLYLKTGAQMSVVPLLSYPATVAFPPPTIPYPADPSQIHLKNASEALDAQNAVAALKSYEEGLTAGVTLQPSTLNDLTSSVNSAAQTIYDSVQAQGVTNVLNPTISAANSMQDMINPEKHYIIPDYVPLVNGSAVGVGQGVTQNYLTTANAATITGELRYDGTQYKFVSDKTVNSILGVNNLVNPTYSFMVQGNSPLLSGAQPVTDSNGLVKLTLPASSPVSWTSDEDVVLSDPVTGRLRGQPMTITFDDSTTTDKGVIPSKLILSPDTYPSSRQGAVSNTAKADNYTYWYNPLDDQGNSLLSVAGQAQANPNIRINDWDVTLKYMDGSANKAVQVISNSPVTGTGGLDIQATPGFPNYNADNFTLRIAPNSVAAQMVSITGEADSSVTNGFASYSLSYFDGTRNVPIPVPESYRDPSLAPTDPNQPYKSIKQVPAGGILGWWNAAGLNGLYTVTLAVVDGSGNTNYAYQSVYVGQKVTQDAVSQSSPFLNVQDPYHRLAVEFPSAAAVSFPVGGQILSVNAMPASLLPVALPPTINPLLPVLDVAPHMQFPATITAEPVISYFARTDELAAMGFTTQTALSQLAIHVFENGFFQPLQTTHQPVIFSSGVTVGWTFTAPTTAFSDFSLLDTTKTIPDPISLNPVTSPTRATTLTVTGFTGGTKDANKQIEYYVSTNPTFVEQQTAGTYPIVTTDANGNFSFQVVLPTDGQYTIFATYALPYVNKNVAKVQVNRDTAPPTASIGIITPNPFLRNHAGAIVFIPLSSTKDGTLRMFLTDAAGNQVMFRQFADSANVPVTFTWNGLDSNNFPVPAGIYNVQLQAEDLAGNLSTQVTSLLAIDTNLPPVISNVTARPNPFSPNNSGLNNATTISYSLNQPMTVNVTIYDQNHNTIRHLAVNSLQGAGNNSLVWDGHPDTSSVQLPAGSYTAVIDGQAASTIAGGQTRAIPGQVVIGIQYLAPVVSNLTVNPNSFDEDSPSFAGVTLGYALSGPVSILKVQILSLAPGGGETLVNDLTPRVDFANSPFLQPGAHAFAWNGLDYAGNKLPKGTYIYRISAQDAAGNGYSPAQAQFMVVDLPPSTPTGLNVLSTQPQPVVLSPDNGSYLNGVQAVKASVELDLATVRLSWNANPEADLDGYYVFRDGQQVTPHTITANTYTDTGASAGVTHVYAIKAVDGAGNTSGLSSSVAVTPQGLASSGVPTYNISINGTARAAGDQYMWDTPLDPEVQMPVQVALTGQVNAVTVSSGSTQSASATFTAARGGTAQWNCVGNSGFQIYQLQPGTNSLVTPALVDTSGSGTGTIPVTQGVQYALFAQSASGFVEGGSLSQAIPSPGGIATVQTTVDRTPPTVPIVSSVTSLGGSPVSVRVTWSPASDVALAGYRLYRAGEFLFNPTVYSLSGPTGLQLPSNQVNAVNVASDRVLVGTPAGLSVIDPASLQAVSTIWTKNVTAVKLHRRWVVVGSQGGGLDVLDSTSYQPVTTRSGLALTAANIAALPGGIPATATVKAIDVDEKDGRVYAAIAANTGFYILDITKPSGPVVSTVAWSFGAGVNLMADPTTQPTAVAFGFFHHLYVAYQGSSGGFLGIANFAIADDWEQGRVYRQDGHLLGTLNLRDERINHLTAVLDLSEGDRLYLSTPSGVEVLGMATGKLSDITSLPAIDTSWNGKRLTVYSPVAPMVSQYAPLSGLGYSALNDNNLGKFLPGGGLDLSTFTGAPTAMLSTLHRLWLATNQGLALLDDLDTQTQAVDHVPSAFPGALTYQVTAFDKAGNESGLSAPFVDNVPPVSSLAFGQPFFGGRLGGSRTAGVTFISSATPVSILSVENSGVSIQQWAVDVPNLITAQSATVAPNTLAAVIHLANLPDGDHVVYFRGIDQAGDVEATQAQTITLDNTPPQTTVRSNTFNFGINSFNNLSMAATDSGAGVSFIRVVVNGVPQTFLGDTINQGAINAPLNPGPNTFQFQAMDNVGNLEPLHSLQVSSGSVVGTTTISFAGPQQNTGHGFYVEPGTQFTLSAPSRPNSGGGLSFLTKNATYVQIFTSSGPGVPFTMVYSDSFPGDSKTYTVSGLVPIDTFCKVVYYSTYNSFSSSGVLTESQNEADFIIDNKAPWVAGYLSPNLFTDSQGLVHTTSGALASFTFKDANDQNWQGVGMGELEYTLINPSATVTLTGGSGGPGGGGPGGGGGGGGTTVTGVTLTGPYQGPFDIGDSPATMILGFTATDLFGQANQNTDNFPGGSTSGRLPFTGAPVTIVIENNPIGHPLVLSGPATTNLSSYPVTWSLSGVTVTGNPAVDGFNAANLTVDVKLGLDNGPSSIVASGLPFLPNTYSVSSPDGHVSDVQVTAHYNLGAAAATVVTENSNTVPTLVDRTAPLVSALQSVSITQYQAVTVSYSFVDPIPLGGVKNTGVAGFELQYRDGVNGNWTPWISQAAGSAAPSGTAVFNGQYGHLYFFRARATDAAGNVGDWSEGDGNAQTFILPPLKVTKTGPLYAVTNNPFSYSLSIQNPISIPATLVTLTDNLPPGITFTDANPAPSTVTDGSLEWFFNTLASNTLVPVTLNVEAGSNTGDAVNTANAAQDVNFTTLPVTWTTHIIPPPLSITKSGPATLRADQPCTYQIVVQETGPIPVTNVVVTDTLPTGVGFVSGSQTPPSSVYPFLQWNLGVMNPGDAVTIAFTADAEDAPGTVFSNQAAINCAPFMPVPVVSNTASTTLTQGFINPENGELVNKIATLVYFACEDGLKVQWSPAGVEDWKDIPASAPRADDWWFQFFGKGKKNWTHPARHNQGNGSGCGFRFADWNTHGLKPGNYQLRLWNAEGNEVVDLINVAVGIPAYEKTLKLPTAAGLKDLEESNDTLYALDGADDQIFMFDPDDGYTETLGGFGNRLGELYLPQNEAAGPDGSLYVADTGNHRVEVFGPAPFTFGQKVLTVPQALDVRNGIVYVLNGNTLNEFDLSGNLLGSFQARTNGPYSGVAVEFDGRIYLANVGSGEVEVYAPDHTFLYAFDGYPGFDEEFKGSGHSHREGTGGNFVPSSIKFVRDRLYITDSFHNKVSKFGLFGNHLMTFGKFGSDHGQFDDPQSSTVNSQGAIYVADAGNKRLEKFGQPAPVLPFAPGGFLAVNLTANPSAFDPSVSGTMLVYTLNQAANVSLAVTSPSEGIVFQQSYLSGGFGGLQGLNQVAWNGMFGGKPLPDGNYNVTLTASANGQQATAQVVVAIQSGVPISLTITNAGANPNPLIHKLKGSTTIFFNLSESADVSITITDKSGVVWKTFGPLSGVSGLNQVLWDGRSNTGQNSPPGQTLYTVTITATNGGQNVSTSFALRIIN